MTSLVARQPRPERYSAFSYRAFRLVEGRTYPLDIGDAADLQEALRAGQVRCFHKDCLAIGETDEDGATKVHIYAIRRKAPQWVHTPGEILPQRVQDHYADPICILDGNAVLDQCGVGRG